MEKVPSKLGKNDGRMENKISGERRNVEQRKGTKAPRDLATGKPKRPTCPASHARTVPSGCAKNSKKRGKIVPSFNQQLVSSTPSRALTEKRPVRKDNRRQNQDLHKTSAPRGSGQLTGKPSGGTDKRISPGDKENILSARTNCHGDHHHHHLHPPHNIEEKEQQRFVETHEVAPQVLNHQVIMKTRVEPHLVKNPGAAGQAHSTGTACSGPLSPTIPQRVTVNPAHQHSKGTSHMIAMDGVPQGVQAPHWVTSPQPPNPLLSQEEMRSNEMGHAQDDHPPLLGRRAHPTNNVDGDQIYYGIHSREMLEPTDPLGGHQSSDWTERQQASLQQLLLQQQYMSQPQRAVSQRSQMYPTSPGRESNPPVGAPRFDHSSASLRTRVQTGVRDLRNVPLGDEGSVGVPKPEKTTQSVLRDLVGKLQEMNRSQPSAAHLTTPQYWAHDRDTNPRSGMAQQDANMRDHVGLSNGDGKGESLIAHTNKRLQHHKPERETARLSEYGSSNGKYEEPVRDCGKSSQNQPMTRSPSSLVTQMQRIAEQSLEDPQTAQLNPEVRQAETVPEANGSIPVVGASMTLQGPTQGQASDDTAPARVQTPPRATRPRVASGRDKGSSALWDQVRTLKYLTKELHSATVDIAHVPVQELLSELEEVVDTLPYTSLDRDLQTEVSLALQPLRSENSQLRRKLRIANQQLRQSELQARGKGTDQSGVSFEVLALQSLNVSLQKQVEERHLEADRLRRDAGEMRATIKTLTENKQSMQDVFKKMDADMKRRRQDWTADSSELRQEISTLKSRLESEALRIETAGRESTILQLSIEQRDKQIQRLQEATRNMQHIISSVIPERSPRSSLPDESKAARLETWLQQHGASFVEKVPTRVGIHNTESAVNIPMREKGEAPRRTGQRSLQGEGHSQSLSSRGGTPVDSGSPLVMIRAGPGAGHSPQKQDLQDDCLLWTKKSEPISTESAKGETGGPCGFDNDSLGNSDSIDADATTYLSLAKRSSSPRDAWLLTGSSLDNEPLASRNNQFDSSLISTPLGGSAVPRRKRNLASPAIWVEEESWRIGHTQKIGQQESAYLGGMSPSTKYVKENNSPQRERRDRSVIRSLGQEVRRVSSAAEVGSVVSESTISSIATQYEAQFQVGLSRLDADIAKLQENLKGLIRR